MKKLFLLAVVIAGLWQIKVPEKASVNNLKQAKPDMPKMPIQIEDVTFICDGREYCSTITSYEAVFFSKNCPETKLDRDKYRVLCARQFAK
ncbi:MAG: hypothetical protein ACI9LX_000249 [Paraglaciecola sp.]|jgi:hypothetical protein